MANAKLPSLLPAPYRTGQQEQRKATEAEYGIRPMQNRTANTTMRKQHYINISDKKEKSILIYEADYHPFHTRLT